MAIAHDHKSESVFDKAKLLKTYRSMYTIRAFEETIYRLFLTRSMPGTIHQYNGQEAVAVGFCESLRSDDYITSTHRGHGHCLAKGAKLNEVMAEIFSKQTGCCRGMGGSMHLADFDVGILGANGIVGGGIPIASGAGLSVSVRGTDQVVVCFFGEGAVNTGAFHEGINMAAILNLPVVFVCENNLYQVSLHVSRAMRIKKVAQRADAYGIPGTIVDGNDVLEVGRAANEAILNARNGRGPTLVECMTYRQRGHSRFEPGNYRPKEEIAEWMERDPLKVFRKCVLPHGCISEEDLTLLEEQIDEEMEQAVAFADKSPDVDPNEFAGMVYAQEGSL